MTKSRLASYLVLVLLAVSGAGEAAELDFNLVGAGARASGLGGAFIGVADDATAAFWNPAGLTQLRTLETSLVFRRVSQNWEESGWEKVDLENWSSSQSYGSFNFASITFPFKLGEKRITTAFAYLRQLDFHNRQQSISPIYPGLWDEEWVPQDIVADGGVDSFSPSVGIQLSDVISLGGTANIWYGKPTTTYTTKFDRGGGDYYNQVVKIDQTYSGLNFVMGAMIDFAGKDEGIPLKIGVTVRTPFELTVDVESLEQEDQVWDGIPSSGTYQQDINDFQKIEIPLMIGGGISFRPSDSFLISGDVELRKFGDSKIKTREVPDLYPSEETFISDSREDLLQFRVGMEYVFVLSAGIIPLRAGFKTVPTLYADSRTWESEGTFQTEFADQVSGNGFTVGGGYVRDRFSLDASFEWSGYTVTDSYDAVFGLEPFTAETEYKTTIFSISGIVYF